MSGSAYLGWLFTTFAVLAAAAILLGVLVDPYRMYGTPEIAGLTALKPRIYEQTGIAKTVQLERIAPNTLLLGNSRVEIGIDPQSTAWQETLRPVFDAAEAGKGVFTSYLMLREAIAVRPPNLIILGVDFLDFLEAPTARDAPLPPIDADERRLFVDRNGAPNASRPWQVWRDRVATTLKIDAVFDSLSTLFDQNPATSTTMTPLGFNPLHEYRVFVARSGYYELFKQKNAIYESQYRAQAVPDFTDPYRIPSMRYLAMILRVSAERRIPLILYIHPYHADYLEMLHHVGLWDSFEDWKRILVKILQAHERETGRHVRLFDFAGYNAYTTEPVPPEGDRGSRMRWYWESGHYKSELGDQLLRVMLDGAPDFGCELVPANVEQDITDIRTARAEFIMHK